MPLLRPCVYFFYVYWNLLLLYFGNVSTQQTNVCKCNLSLLFLLYTLLPEQKMVWNEKILLFIF